MKQHIIMKIKNNKINCIKTNNKFNKINEISSDDISIIKKFCEDLFVYIENEKVLKKLLKLMYETKIYDFTFKYMDMKESKQYKIFRGLNYPKYLCDVKLDDKKYYGYIIDFSKDKYISYYMHLKEINKKYISLKELKKLKKLGAVVIMNASYYDSASIKFTDYYSLHTSNNVTSKCNKLLEGINNIIENNMKILLWGDINTFKKTYGILGKEKLNKLTKLLFIIKKPWDYFRKEELNI